MPLASTRSTQSLLVVFHIDQDPPLAVRHDVHHTRTTASSARVCSLLLIGGRPTQSLSRLWHRSDPPIVAFLHSLKGSFPVAAVRINSSHL